jgi:hypothetical protein
MGIGRSKQVGVVSMPHAHLARSNQVCAHGVSCHLRKVSYLAHCQIIIGAVVPLICTATITTFNRTCLVVGAEGVRAKVHGCLAPMDGSMVPPLVPISPHHHLRQALSHRIVLLCIARHLPPSAPALSTTACMLCVVWLMLASAGSRCGQQSTAEL